MEQDNPFIPAFQRKLLAILLQLPETYSRYNGIWDPTYFDDPLHRKIVYAYLHVRLVDCNQPAQLSIEQELFKDYDTTKDLPTDAQKLKEEFEALYTIRTDNVNYSLDAVRKWAQHHAIFKALETSVNYIKEPEKILPLFTQALNVGTNIGLAGDDFFSTEPRLPAEIIPGVLSAESIAILVAPSKSFKTWNLLAACIAVAMGKRWMGFERCEPANVLYVNLELHPEQLKKRVDMVAAAMGTNRAVLQGRVDFLNLKGERNQIDRVLATVRSMRSSTRPWRLILIDPIYKLYSSDSTKENSENSTSAIGLMFEKLEMLARELETAIIFAHHFRKGNQGAISDIDLASGSGVFARAPDCMIYLRELEDEEKAWRCSLVLRYFSSPQPFGVRLGADDKFPLLIRDESLDLSKEAGKPGAKTKYYVEDVGQFALDLNRPSFLEAA